MFTFYRTMSPVKCKFALFFATLAAVASASNDRRSRPLFTLLADALSLDIARLAALTRSSTLTALLDRLVADAWDRRLFAEKNELCRSDDLKQEKVFAELGHDPTKPCVVNCEQTLGGTVGDPAIRRFFVNRPYGYPCTHGQICVTGECVPVPRPITT